MNKKLKDLAFDSAVGFVLSEIPEDSEAFMSWYEGRTDKRPDDMVVREWFENLDDKYLRSLISDIADPQESLIEAALQIDRDPLVNAINDAWIKRYGGEVVTEPAALVNRVKSVGQDRDSWLAIAKENQKEYLRLDKLLRDSRGGNDKASKMLEDSATPFDAMRDLVNEIPSEELRGKFNALFAATAELFDPACLLVRDMEQKVLLHQNVLDALVDSANENPFNWIGRWVEHNKTAELIKHLYSKESRDLIAESKTEAMRVALEKVGAVQEVNEATGRYTGKIVYHSEHHVVQELGRGAAAIHELRKFPPQALGDIPRDKPVKIQYSAGRATIAAPVQHEHNLDQSGR